MIKKINKIVISLMIIGVALLTENVYAGFSAKLSYGDKNLGTEVKYCETMSDGKCTKWGSYSQAEQFLEDSDGFKYTAHCIDPGLHANTNNVYKCVKMKNTEDNSGDKATEAARAYAWVLNRMDKNELDSRVVRTLTIRLLAVHYDLYNMEELTEKGSAIKKYIDNIDKAIEYEEKAATSTKKSEADKYTKKAKEYRQKASQYMKDTAEKTGDEFLRRALNYYERAIEAGKTSDGSEDKGFSGKISYEKISFGNSDGYVATYKVTSTESQKNIKFECKNCTIIRETWEENGTEGEVTIKVNNGSCDYEIQAQFMPESGGNCTAADIMVCTYKENQRLIIAECEKFGSQSILSYADVPNSKGGSLTDTVAPGNAYYDNYCAPKCDEPTKITTPGICDSKEEEKITVKGPENKVVSCVLHGTDDAGASYQDVKAVPKDNNYCQVYCKEDYDITLPGAQYADSGRYFKLKNTIVTNTRTCYTAGPTGANIQIDNYVLDIINAQRSLVSARDAYLKALAEQSAPVETHTSSGCGTDSSTWYTKPSVSYIGIEVTNCNNQTGLCQTRSVTHTTDSYEWGDEYGTSTYTCGTEHRPSTCCETTSKSHGTEPDWNGNVASTRGALESRNAEVKKIISQMEQCYNWDNEICLDDKITFDYNEPYKNQINYDVVSSNNSTNSKISYKQGLGIDEKYTTPINNEQALEYISYVSCDASGCGNDNQANHISTLATQYYYRKVISESKEEYNNKTEFQTNYPHGNIETVTDKNNLHSNYTYLGAVFPLALKTEKGQYTWTMKISNLGQYGTENNCKKGRVDKVVEKVQGNKKLSTDLGYVCVYVVDCPDCPSGCECPSGTPDGYTCYINDQHQCVIKPPCDDCEVECENCIFDGKDNYTYRTISVNDVFPNERKTGENWSNIKGTTTKEIIEKQAEEIYKEPQYSYTFTALNMKNIRDYNEETRTYVESDLNYHDLESYKNVYGTSYFLDEGEKKGFFTENTRNTKWTLWTGEIIAGKIGPSWK